MTHRSLRKQIRTLEIEGARLLSLLVDYNTVIHDLTARGAPQLAEYLQGMRNQLVLQQADNEIALADARQSLWQASRSVQ